MLRGLLLLLLHLRVLAASGRHLLLLIQRNVLQSISIKDQTLSVSNTKRPGDGGKLSV